MNVDIAKRLADRRRQAGLTQEGLAEKLDVTRQAVSKWERSESSPDTDNLIALAELYGVSLDELLYGDVDEGADGQGKDASCDPAAGDEPGQAAEAVFAEAEVIEGDGAEGGQDASSEHGCDAGPESDGRFHVGPGGIHVEDDGNYVHINWQDGVNVIDGKSGDKVHVGWDGVHVNDRWYDSLREANEAVGAHPRGPHGHHGPRTGGSWLRFPFPLFVIVAYLLVGALAGQWGLGLFLFFLIPVYYLLGAAVTSKRVAPFLAGLYPLGAVAWFCWMAFVLNQPHPAWVVFLTIPLVEWVIFATAHWWAKRKRAKAE